MSIPLMFKLSLLLLVCLHDFMVAQVSHYEMPEKGLCAHRGAMKTHPENTLIAFQAAIDVGAHMIEFDVRLTADQHLVIIHDERVDRTTDGSGQVSEMTLKQLRKLDAGSWMHDRFKGVQIPTLAETLEMMPMNIWVNVHLKNAPGIGGLVAREIHKQNRLHQCFLACMESTAAEARLIIPQIKICNMERQSSNWEYVNQTVERKAAFIQLKGNISNEYEAFARYLTANNVNINYFGTDRPEEIAHLFKLGVEFPLVNNIIESMLVSTNLGIPPVTPIYSK